MDNVQKFVFSLKDNYTNLIDLRGISENKFDGIIQFCKSLLFIFPALFFFFKYTILKKRIKVENIEDVQEHLNNKQKNYYRSQIIQGIIFILLGIRLYYYFKPNNTQISLALLIKYLKEKNLLDENFYSIIKNFKPENISI
jgi:hypothetical protein